MSITIGIDIDDSNAQAKINNLTALSDEATRKAKQQRDEVVRGIRTGITLLNSFMSTTRQFFALTEQQIDPFFGALIGMTTGLISMLLSAGTVLAGTGVGTVAAAALFSAAITVQSLTLVKLIKDKAVATDNFAEIRQAMDALINPLTRGGSL